MRWGPPVHRKGRRPRGRREGWFARMPEQLLEPPRVMWIRSKRDCWYFLILIHLTRTPLLEKPSAGKTGLGWPCLASTECPGWGRSVMTWKDYNGFWTLPRMANHLSKSHLKVDVVVRESLVDGRQNLLSHLKGRPYISRAGGRAGGRAGVRSPTPWNANIWKPRPFLRPVLVGWFDLPSGIAPRSVRRHRAPDMR